MVLFQRKPPGHFIPIHPDNARKKDWIILVEASTIVGTPRDKLRVAQTTLERTIAKRYSLSLKVQHYLVVEGYDPRIHALYFCPQLYRYDDDKLVPLQGEEIGTLIARALERGVADRRPWYEPSERTPDRPVIDAPMLQEFDSVVVEMPSTRNSSTAVASMNEPSTKGRGPAR
jgi:hypothetical protein